MIDYYKIATLSKLVDNEPGELKVEPEIQPTLIAAAFPERMRNHKLFHELQQILEAIYGHKAFQRLDDPDCLNKVIESSLLFTVCFYANALALLRHTVNSINPGMQEDMARLRRVITLISGELTDVVSSPKDSRVQYGPHYVLMLRATETAGVSAEKIRKYVLARQQPYSLEEAFQQVGFSAAVADYLRYSDQCCGKRLHSLMTIAGRELFLSFTFKVILEHLPDEDRLLLVRDFYRLHVNLDKEITTQDSHSQLMFDELNTLTDHELDEGMVVLITFFARRLAVYNLCLAPGANL